MIESDTKPRRAPQVAYRELHSEGGVLLHLESGQYHGVNRTGLEIWELLDGERTVEEVIAELRSRLDKPPPTLERDVTEFLGGLSERRLTLG
jgi:Coenzyme PQQ synthesis protein D (PqqD)